MHWYGWVAAAVLLLAPIAFIQYTVIASNKLHQDLDAYKGKDWRYDG